MRTALFTVLFVIGSLLAPSRSSRADFISVDFGVIDSPSFSSFTPNNVATGFFDFSATPRFNGTARSDSVSTNLDTLTRTFNGIGVSLAPGLSNGLQWDDYVGEVNDTGGIPGDLIEERVRVVQGDMFLTLSNLPTGRYSFRGFHHDVGGVANALPFNIFLDAGSGEQLVASNVATSVGLTPALVSTTLFEFQVTGSNVIIRLDGGGSGANLINPVLNGFQISSVPEPGSLLLLGALGSIASSARLVRYRFRKRASRSGAC